MGLTSPLYALLRHRRLREELRLLLLPRPMLCRRVADFQVFLEDLFLMNDFGI